MNKAVLLDRDGTINLDKDYVYKIEDWEFIPRSVEGLKMLFDAGYKLVFVTNQSGIGRGYYKEEDMEKLHKYVLTCLKEKGIEVAGIYFCPHHPAAGKGKYKMKCACRKPGTLMAEKAIKDLSIDVSQSFCIGDKTGDIKMGKDTGFKTILVKTGKGGNDCDFEVEPDFIAGDLYDGAEYIVKNRL